MSNYTVINKSGNIDIYENGINPKSFGKQDVSVRLTDLSLQLIGSQSPYLVLATWNASNVSSLNGSATLVEGANYLNNIISR